MTILPTASKPYYHRRRHDRSYRLFSGCHYRRLSRLVDLGNEESDMKNNLAVFALIALTLFAGWLIWGVGGRVGDFALGGITGISVTIVAGIWLAQSKGKTDEPS